MKVNELNVFVEGKGQAMILLHGWGCDHTLMEPIYDHFKDHYKVCNLDLPGFGVNQKLDHAYTIYDYVVVLKNIVQTYHLNNPIIIAHSFGCRIAFHYAALFPCRFLILTGAAGIKPRRTPKYYAKVYFYKMIKSMGISISMGSKDYKEADPLLRRTLVHVVNDDCSSDIKKIKCPILLVWGEEDYETPLWMAEKIQTLNENASLISFEKDDHFAYYHQMSRFLKICEIALKECD